jgi:hypothetical protein
MNFSWPHRAAGKSGRRSAARVGLAGFAVVAAAGAAALAAPAMSAMAATGTNATTSVLNIPFPDSLPAETAAPIPFTVTDTVAGGPAPTGTFTVTSAGAYNPQLPADDIYSCSAALTPSATLNAAGLAYSTGTCTIDVSATGVPLGVGFVEIVGNYPGDANNAASNTDATENKIVNLVQSVTTLTPDTATAGKAVTLKATVGPGNLLYASGSDEVFNGTPNLVTFTVTNGTGATVATCANVMLTGPSTAQNDPPNYADCSVTLPAGKYNVLAAFDGDEYATASQGTETLTVAAAAQTTATTMSSMSVYAGSKVTLAAKVKGDSTPTGTVKFVDGSKALCSGTLSGGAAHCTYTFGSVGSFKVVAEFEGNAANKASSSSATVTVKKDPTSVTVTATKATKDKAVTITATVKSLTTASGTVTFSIGGHTYKVTLVKGKASVKFTWKTAGTYKVTASYGGNSTHASSKGTASVKVAA